MIQTIKYIPIFFMKLLAYIPVLWRDRDYDYAHLLRLMEFKLGRMGREIQKNEIRANNHEVVMQMNRVREKLRFFYEDQNTHPALEGVYKRYGKHECSMIESGKGFSSLVWVWKDLKTLAEINAADRALNAAYAIVLSDEEQKWAQLWRELEYNVRDWWD